MTGASPKPTCPKCETAMVLRRRRSDGAEFWGCPRYPACHGTRELAVVETTAPALEAPEDEAHEVLNLELPARPSIAGGSARAEFERRRTRDRAVIRKQRPLILAFGAAFAVGGLVLAAFGPVPSGPLGPSYRMLWLLVPLAAVSATLGALFLPNTTLAWRTGALGEERTAELLRPLEAQGFRVMHDRLMPRSRANIDHIVVGPPGVFIVETKNYGGKLRVRHGEVWVAGRRKTEIVAQAKREAAAVAAVVSPVSVTPLLCVHRADLGWFKMEADGVRIVAPKEMVRVLGKAPLLLTPDDVTRLADQIDKSLVPAVIGKDDAIGGA
jgi:hypothetical protein